MSQSRTSSLRSLLRMAWQNERLSKDPFEGRFWLVVQKQCKWSEVNQKSNMADQIARKIVSKPGLLMFASAAITLRSKVNTLLTFTGQRWRRNQFYFCCRGLNDMTNGWISSNYSKVINAVPHTTRMKTVRQQDVCTLCNTTTVNESV